MTGRRSTAMLVAFVVAMSLLFTALTIADAASVQPDAALPLLFW